MRYRDHIVDLDIEILIYLAAPGVLTLAVNRGSVCLFRVHIPEDPHQSEAIVVDIYQPRTAEPAHE